jgi:pimeloyl-ACP methyl ester carboxylesterase
MILDALDQAIAAIMAGAPIPAKLRQVYGVGGLASMDGPQLAYLRACEATDPCAVLSGISLPTMIVQGDDDASVTPEHAHRLRDAHANGGKARVTELLELPGLSHFYKMVPAGTDPQAAFGWPGPCDLRVVEGVAPFITREVARA